MTNETTSTRRGDRPAQARSATTRRKLVQAALEVIYDVGFKSASTPEFSRRAGVSRGALLHHFPTRSDIIVAAMEELLRENTREIRQLAGAVAAQEISLGEFVEFLWQMFSGRFFFLSLEFINEARTDSELRGRMKPVVRDFHAALDGIWSEFEKQAEGQPATTRVALNMTVCLVRGMGVQTVLKDDPAYFRAILEAWKAILPQLLNASRPGPLRPA
ncbi:putative transcriptional regulator [Oceanicola granulosus HTCC2516]|uniref:Putative transcriptional regulator n=1 Tax=Oceanicola granulosus (strain ATCC BAA-861 / DSM 15982 / KCTC 12143 / HTCC2516) TaxID=314256 RepID=Q2CJA5_OCEGH|nr:TetR/AcrR family transcriptional regulator [Oceanicola granulosus]EAR52695.1 putative transcriptional regulator [Oceanicola granulosus HTCC2516]